MNDRRVTGIGCFGKPSTLSRVFRKMVQNYSLERFEGLDLINGHKTGVLEGAVLLKALIAGDAGVFPSPAAESGSRRENKKITGFFLTLRNQKLNLSIFAKGDRNGLKRYTTSLETLTEIRRKRLN